MHCEVFIEDLQDCKILMENNLQKMKTVPATIPANEYEFHSVLVTTFQEHSISFLCIIFNVLARKKEEKNISLRMYT